MCYPNLFAHAPLDLQRLSLSVILTRNFLPFLAFRKFSNDPSWLKSNSPLLSTFYSLTRKFQVLYSLCQLYVNSIVVLKIARSLPFAYFRILIQTSSVFPRRLFSLSKPFSSSPLLQLRFSNTETTVRFLLPPVDSIGQAFPLNNNIHPGTPSHDCVYFFTALVVAQ